MPPPIIFLLLSYQPRRNYYFSDRIPEFILLDNVKRKRITTDQDELRKYFGEILKDEGYIQSESLAVFGKLIRLTLEYRDRLFAEKGEILTVAETRTALDAYMITLESGKIPENLEGKILGLVKLWLKQINGKSY